MDKEYKVAALLGGRDCAQFIKTGMAGVERKNPNRPVSLMSLESRQSVDQADQRGLCYARFTADITLDCARMPDTGTIIGHDELRLGILPERKQCWPECCLLQNKLPCPLIDGVRFAQVKSPGLLCQGDHLKIIEVRGQTETDEG